MTVITTIIKRLTRLNVNRIIKEVLVPEFRFIADLQRQQLNAGIDSEGLKIIPKYTKRTIAIKKAKGQPTDRVTLKDTGKFQKAIKVTKELEGLVVISKDPKTEELIFKYGSEIFGLTDENLEILRRLVTPTMIKKIQEALLSI